MNFSALLSVEMLFFLYAFAFFVCANTSIDAWGDLECSVALPEGKATAGISRTKHSTGAHPH